MISACGAVFFASGLVRNETMYAWTCLLGSLDEAKNYSCTYSVTNKEDETFYYNGKVHTVDKGKDDIIASGSFLGINIDAVKRSLIKDHLKVEITIRNLKEEAKDDDMESGISDND